MFFLGSLIVFALPLVFIKTKFNKKKYIHGLFVHVFYVLERRFNFLNWHKFIFGKSQSGKGVHYSEVVLKRNKADLIKEYKKQIIPIINDWKFLLVLSSIQIFWVFLDFSWLIIINLLLFIVLFSFSYFQKSMMIVRLNSLWLPISILSAKTISDFIIIWDYKTLVFLVLIGAYFYKNLIHILLQYKKENRWRLADYEDKYSKYFYISKEVGEYIKSKSNENEKVLSWGNMISLYIYAQREAFDVRFFHIYPNTYKKVLPAIKALLISMKQNPPEWLVFFTGIYPKPDKWNIQTLTDEINIPYKLSKNFQVKTNGITHRPIPVYRRDDELYCELLIEKYRITKDISYLNKVLEIDTENNVALFWLKLEKNDLDFEKATVELESFDSKIDNVLVQLDLMKKFDKLTESEIIISIEKLNTHEKSWRYYLELGELYFNKGDYQKALDLYTESSKLNSLSVELFNNFGVLAYQLNDKVKSIEFLSKAIQILPEYIEAKENLEEIKKIIDK